MGGRKFNIEDLRRSPTDNDFKWDPELVRSWRIREFSEKPATQSRWPGRILLCVRNRGELLKFPGLDVLSRDVMVRWWVRNCFGMSVLGAEPSKMSCPDGEAYNFNYMDGRSPGDSMLWIWPGKEGIKTCEVASRGNVSVKEGGQSNKNDKSRGGGIGAESE